MKIYGWLFVFFSLHKTCKWLSASLLCYLFPLARHIFVPVGLRLIPASTFSSRWQKIESSGNQTSVTQNKPSSTSLMSTLITNYTSLDQRGFFSEKENKFYLRSSSMKVCLMTGLTAGQFSAQIIFCRDAVSL